MLYSKIAQHFLFGYEKNQWSEAQFMYQQPKRKGYIVYKDLLISQ